MTETKEFWLLSRYELIARSRQPDIDDVRETAGICLQREHPIAEVDRLIQIMRHKQRRGAAVFDEAADFVLQRLAGERIQRAKGLVHQENTRLLRQAAGDLYPLLHPAGKLSGIFVAVAGEADLLEQRPDAHRALATGEADRFQRQG